MGSPKTDANRILRQRRRAEWIALNGPCRRCLSWDNPTIDHIDKTTKDPELLASRGGNTKDIWGWNEHRRAVELAKCQVLCTHCHRLKTTLEDRRDPAEMERQARELEDKRQRLFGKSAYQIMLETEIPLPSDVESRIEEIRRKYGWDDEVIDAEVVDEDPVPRLDDSPGDLDWLRQLIKMPY